MVTSFKNWSLTKLLKKISKFCPLHFFFEYWYNKNLFQVKQFYREDYFEDILINKFKTFFFFLNHSRWFCIIAMIYYFKQYNNTQRNITNHHKSYNTLAAFINSSAKHSAIVLMFLKAASRAPVHRSQIAWFTRRRGETSTACLLTVPARPIRVESSLGPLLIIAFTNTWRGFWKKKKY